MTMHPAAARVVRQAVAAGGKIDPIEHFADLTTLDRLAREQQCPSLDERLHVLDHPIAVGGALLYRLSWAAWEWSERAMEWFDEEPLCELVVPWAMAHARRKDELDRVSNKRLAARAIRKWARSLDCSVEGLMAACKALLPDTSATENADTPARQTDNSLGYGPVLTRLVQECGQTFEYWMHEVPLEVVLAVDNALAQQDNAARAAAKIGGRDPRSWEVRNFVAFNRYSKQFLAKVSGA